MKVGIVGFGNMGRAIAEGLQRRGSETQILVFDKLTSRSDEAAADVGAQVCDSPADICREADLLVIAVKPQNTDDLLTEFGDFTEKANVLSVVTGKSISYFRMGLRTNRVVRCMPNIAATVGKAFVGISIPTDTEDTLRSQALEVAEAMGTPIELPEALLAAVTGISGSGIAFVFAFVHALALGGTKAGLDYDTALRSAVEVVEGSCALLKSSKEHPIALVSRVASPAGTTIAGLKALEQHAFTATVMEAVEQAAERAAELDR